MRTLKKILTLSFGTIVAAFGIDVAINAQFGGATLAILWQGISKVLHITIGQASLLFAGVLLLFVFFYDRTQISWGTIIYQVLYSFFMDFFQPFLKYSSSAFINFFLMIIGLCIFIFGAALYSYADFGRGPYEALMFSLSNKNGWQIRNVRIGQDIFCVVAGLLLGGKAGLCTVATILLSGPLIQFFLKVLNRFDPVKINQPQ